MFNIKINTDGTYRKFYGWTVICNSNYDMKYVENYLRNSQYISYYFSALPSASYHVTIYNVWCNLKRLLKPQQNAVNLNPSLASKSKELGWFNPENCLNDLFVKISEYCNRYRSLKINLIPDKVVYTGGTLALLFKQYGTDEISVIRDGLTNIVENEDGMGYFHMTLAYKYKNISEIDTEKINNELYMLNIAIENLKISLKPPELHSFESMLSFESM